MNELYNTIVQAQGTLTLSGDNAVYSDTFSMSKATHTSFALSWENLTSFNARAILQCSVDGTNWNDMGGDTEGIILDTEEGGRLDVYGSVANKAIATFQNAGSVANTYGIAITCGADDGSGQTFYMLCNDGDGDNIGYIENNNSGTFQLVDVSDVRLKTNIETTIINGLDIINNVRVVDFNRIKNPSGEKITGFIAQELQPYFNQAISIQPDGDHLGVSRDTLVPVLWKAIQELSFKNDEQQSEIESKNNEIETLKSQMTDVLARLSALEG